MKKVAATSGHKVNLADGLLETDEEFDDAALFGSKGGTLARANFGGCPPLSELPAMAGASAVSGFFQNRV